MKTNTQTHTNKTTEGIFSILYLLSLPAAIAYYCINFL